MLNVLWKCIYVCYVKSVNQSSIVGPCDMILMHLTMRRTCSVTCSSAIFTTNSIIWVRVSKLLTGSVFQTWNQYYSFLPHCVCFWWTGQMFVLSRKCPWWGAVSRVSRRLHVWWRCGSRAARATDGVWVMRGGRIVRTWMLKRVQSTLMKQYVNPVLPFFRTTYYTVYQQTYRMDTHTVCKCCPGWTQRGDEAGCLHREC